MLFPLVLCPVRSRADYTTTVDPSKTWGAWEGWGASLAWWANAFGDRDDLADILYTDRQTPLLGEKLPGLNLNVVRYNAGGSGRNAIGEGSDNRMVASPSIPQYKQIQGYWLDWTSADPGSASWDWSADARQRAMLLKAKARGANLFELFSNSPMWWMLYNHNPSGTDDKILDTLKIWENAKHPIGVANNLQDWNDQNHAVYLATVARYAGDHWGIRFDSVEPFNEPTGSDGRYFWKASGSQEGCNFDHALQKKVIGYLRGELDKRGLRSVRVAASDENTYSSAIATWRSLGDKVRSLVGRLNVHGYEGQGGRRDVLFKEAAGRRIWNSEYGDGDGTGMTMAGNLNLDLRWLHPTAWNYWQPLDASGGWGFIKFDDKDLTIEKVNAKYFVMAQFTRHIAPGMEIIDGGEGNTVAAYDARGRKLVLVTTNYGTGQWINYDLSRFSHVGGPVTRWATVTGGGDRYAQHQDTELHETKFWSWFDKNTVQTFEVQDVIP